MILLFATYVRASKYFSIFVQLLNLYVRTLIYSVKVLSLLIVLQHVQNWTDEDIFCMVCIRVSMVPYLFICTFFVQLGFSCKFQHKRASKISLPANIMFLSP